MTINAEPHSLAAALEPRHGTKARALARAYEQFADHGNRARFEAEVQAIQSCVLVAFIEHKGMQS